MARGKRTENAAGEASSAHSGIGTGNGPLDTTIPLLNLTADERAAAMQELEAEVRGCPLCRLALTRTHAVPGDGSYSTVVLFVGEGPGFDEDKQGLPFVGRSGQFLTENLKRVGVNRADVYITNIVKCRPPENRDPEADEIDACAGYLTRQVALINPRIIVTLGRHSMNRWVPGGSITRIHGQVRNLGHGRILLPMFHPAAALRNPAWRTEFEKDIEKLPALIERAQRANAAAARGEAPAAGMPHPGDADFAPPAGPAPQPEAPADASAQASAAQASAAQEDASRRDDDGPAQMRLF